MKRTYTRTTRFNDLTKATFKLYIYDEPKYGRDFDCNVIEYLYKDVVSFVIIQGGKEAKEIEKEMAPDYDDYNEYLILHFKDGTQATFRYSYVDMFILKSEVEIVTCKDCKHWHDDGIMTTCDKNIGNGFPKDYYCADAERRG